MKTMMDVGDRSISAIQRHGAPCSRLAHNGFTLIELLTAMAVLSVLAVAVANLFSHSATAWDSGTRRAQSMLVGRALTDYFVRETAMAMGAPYAPDGSGYSLLKGSNPWQDESYDLTGLIGNTTRLSAAGPSPAFPNNNIVTFQVVVTTDDKGRKEDRLHKGRAFLWNRNRYAFD